MSLRQKVEALLPVPQSYSYRSVDDIPKYRMPFVKVEGLRPISFWSVPKTDCYETGCILGQEYAGHYLQYLKANPGEYGNFLGEIVKDMKAEPNQGFAVGFLSYLEEMLCEWVQSQCVYDRLIQEREESIQVISEVLASDGQQGVLAGGELNHV
ncbi:MAG: hypothetical protein CMI12_01615 [Oceanospirillum sp.]|nr:hypothetical protein [Oceanospirillum sp.]